MHFLPQYFISRGDALLLRCPCLFCDKIIGILFFLCSGKEDRPSDEKGDKREDKKHSKEVKSAAELEEQWQSEDEKKRKAEEEAKRIEEEKIRKEEEEQVPDDSEGGGGVELRHTTHYTYVYHNT